MAVGVFVGVFLLGGAGEKAANAQAQPLFGDGHQLVITAENLFGFVTERTATETSTGETSVTNNRLSFLWAPGGSTIGRSAWVGGHFFVIPNLSLGATLGVISATQSRTTMQNNVTVTQEQPSSTGFVFVPKVGYALMMTDMLGFWFRGGPGFFRAGTSNVNNSGGSAQSYWFLSIDALFVITPAQHIGFYVGPQGNFSFAGTVSSTTPNGLTTSLDATYRSFSIDAGLFGYFDL